MWSLSRREPCTNFVPRLFPVRGRRLALEHAKGPQRRAFRVIGETGFEPATARPPAGCATRLRHSPYVVSKAGDGNRTRPRSLEGFCAATTLRPHGGRASSYRRADGCLEDVFGQYPSMQIPGVHIE